MTNVVIDFRDFLRTHLTDPANRGGQWIFDNYPREDFGKNPIVTVVGIGEHAQGFGLGNTAWLGRQILQIDIWCRDDVGFTINNKTYYDKDLCIYLSDYIERIIRTYWVQLPISLIELTDKTPLNFNQNKLLWGMTMTYEVQQVEVVLNTTE
jgi:hypothetical protein